MFTASGTTGEDTLRMTYTSFSFAHDGSLLIFSKISYISDGWWSWRNEKILWMWRPRQDRNYFKFSRCSRVNGTSFKYTWRYWFWLATFRFEIRKVWNGQWLAPPEVYRSSQTWTGSVAKLLCILALGGLESRSDWSAVEWNKKVWGDHTDAAVCRP